MTTSKTPAGGTQVPGLCVEKAPSGGWFIRHESTRLPASPDVRLRRQAEVMLAEMGATGVDFTLPTAAEVQAHPDIRRLAEVIGNWRDRAFSDKHDPVSGEYCNTTVHYGSCGTPEVPGVACPRCRGGASS